MVILIVNLQIAGIRGGGYLQILMQAPLPVPIQEGKRKGEKVQIFAIFFRRTTYGYNISINSIFKFFYSILNNFFVSNHTSPYILGIKGDSFNVINLVL